MCSNDVLSMVQVVTPIVRPTNGDVRYSIYEYTNGASVMHSPYGGQWRPTLMVFNGTEH